MISYIAYILGHQGQINSTTTDETRSTPSPASSHYVSCPGYGWTVPDLAVRLQVMDDNNLKVRIFGYPPQEEFPESTRCPPDEKGPYVQYLVSESPAMINYIMGDDWRSRLESDHWLRPNGVLRERLVIFRPSSTRNATIDHSQTVLEENSDLEADERAHSLLMRRCGAVAMAAESEAYHWNSRSKIRAPDFFFGWPKDGGVWVLRPSWSQPPPVFPDGYPETDEEIMEENWKKAERDRFYLDLALEVQRQDDMEDVCRVLEAAGAQFYKSIEDCPEAVERNLC